MSLVSYHQFFILAVGKIEKNCKETEKRENEMKCEEVRGQSSSFLFLQPPGHHETKNNSTQKNYEELLSKKWWISISITTCKANTLSMNK